MSRLFRKSFLRDLTKRTDDLLVVVPDRFVPLFWPVFVVLTLSLSFLATWMFTAKIPILVETDGVVVVLGGVREIPSFGTGIVIESAKKANESVEAGEVLMRISDPVAELAYEGQRNEFLAQKRQFNAERKNLEDELNAIRRNTELRILEADRNLDRLNAIHDELALATEEYETKKKILWAKIHNSSDDVKKIYDLMQPGVEALRDKGIASQDRYLNFYGGRAVTLRSAYEAESEIAFNEIEIQRLFREVNELEGQVVQEEINKQKMQDDLASAVNRSQSEIQKLAAEELKITNALMDSQRKLWLQSNAFSTYSGKLIAKRKTAGQSVTDRESLALLSLVPQKPKRQLVISPQATSGSLGFSLKGRLVEIPFSPDKSVFERSLLSGLKRILGESDLTIKTVSDQLLISKENEDRHDLEELQLASVSLYDDLGIPQFSFLSTVGDNWEETDLVAVSNLRPADGKRVAVGQRASIRPYFEKPLIGAQISAEVISVSDFATTPIEIQALVGSSELATTFRSNETSVAAVLKLHQSEDGSLRLTRGQLGNEVTVGTLAVVNIHVETSSPIAALLPLYLDVLK